MTGWDGYPIRSWFADPFDCPVLVDNDANAMTLGEHTSEFSDRDSLVMVKVATGIGAGIIAQGSIYRGADGAAGDIGHIQISPPDATPEPPPVCRCGNIGCIEAYGAAGPCCATCATAGRDVAADRRRGATDRIRRSVGGQSRPPRRAASSALPCPMSSACSTRRSS